MATTTPGHDSVTRRTPASLEATALAATESRWALWTATALPEAAAEVDPAHGKEPEAPAAWGAPEGPADPPPPAAAAALRRSRSAAALSPAPPPPRRV